MQFNFSNINTQYNQTDAIAAIAKENESATKSNISSVYNSSALNLDAAVLSISTKGSAKINAMLSKSIQLRASSTDPLLTPADRQEVTQELREIRKEIEEIRSEEKPKNVDKKETASTEKKSVEKTNAKTTTETEDVELNPAEAEQMMTESRENILKHANESIQSQVLNRERILQLL